MKKLCTGCSFMELLLIFVSVSSFGQSPPVLTAQSSVALGDTITYQITGAPPLEAYIVDLSKFGTSPGLYLPETSRLIPLNPPYALSHWRLHEVTPFFINHIGTTDAAGGATALFQVPPAPHLIGATISACFGSADPTSLDGLGSVSNAVQTSLYSQAQAQLVSSVSQFGITWTFSQPRQVGQFINGDYWVLGPVNIISISPPSSTSGGRTINGSMLNPMSGTENQGYDSSMGTEFNAGEYQASLNVALGVSVSSPLTLSGLAIKSLVSTISHPVAGDVPQTKTAAVLTVLDSAPPADAFRPPYAGMNKSVAYTYSQIDATLLQNLPPVASTPSMQSVSNMFERPWIDHIAGWKAIYQHPSDNMPHYGQYMADEISHAALMLHLDFPLAQKQELLTRFVQLGIDLKGVADSNGATAWTPNGGHASGRKWPILFSGMLLNDPAMIATTHTATSSVLFGEDGQTFIVQSGPGGINGGYGGYTSAHIGMPEWGMRHATEPIYDDVRWWVSGEWVAYRVCCTANSWVGIVLAAHITPGGKAAWNHTPLFQYQDRYMATQGGFYRSWSDFSEEMWDTYRALYGSVWPNP